jgi:hypothetical protein
MVDDWKFELKERVKDSPQVEIRDGHGIVIVVSLGGGYKYKYYGKRSAWRTKEQALDMVRGVNVHLALNGAMQCTFEEWSAITILIERAREMLEDVVEVIGDESFDEA